MKKEEKDKNTESAKAHLQSTVTQTEAAPAADAYAGVNCFPPDDDRFYSASSVSKNVRVELRKYRLAHCALVLLKLVN